ncbi:raffinose/stachyose/melibiose transport system permease protein [Actinoplanes lutulentus]|uniref:Raffinose/stachyose/melibiose transport system permease protein n=1 Tax=Actinoplanes lutulentus TaxID=1287878 RepID=A0A327Z0Z7_9ACTN|nr:carbohydrate ABC transporter permease [Actinoplanes lutulentus]MBB2948688.1 raffinose/stachyose/melibiose transport system permease protein [Actinoplanes lutulentus]RAK27941.1 raffinose/stachyose/melibiose transport system permease protein [Actinoplanes lutulentus]
MTVVDTEASTRTLEDPSPKAAKHRNPVRFAVLFALVVLLLLLVGPLLVVAVNAVKSPADYAASGPLSIPTHLYWDGIVDFWNRVNFGQKLWNSFITSLVVAVLGVVLSILNAYALGIGKVKGRVWFLVFFLVANLLPQEVLVYPLYYIGKEIGLYDNLISIIIIFTVIQSAFGTYLLTSVYAEFPKELLEAASIDGAGKWRALWQVVVPVSRPTLAVLFTFFFIWTWNEFFLPLIFLISNDNQTVPVALGVLQGDRMMDATTTSASALIGILPAMLFFLLFQRTLTRGIAAGAIK